MLQRPNNVQLSDFQTLRRTGALKRRSQISGTSSIFIQSMGRAVKHEWSKYYRIPGTSIEALHAGFVTHQYPRHSHDFFVIGLIEAGAQSYWYRGARHVTPEGQVFLVNPDEPHTGESAAAEGYVYETLYPHPQALAGIAGDVTGTARAPYFAAAVLKDPLLAHALSKCHACIASNAGSAECELLFLQAMERLITAHAGDPCTLARAGSERPAVKRTREYLEANFAEDVSLAELAQLASLSPYYFARAFEKEVGLPPHRYLEGVRIRRAKALLAAGESIAATAVSVGYADQSHLSRRFKRFLGINPGQYVAEFRRSGAIRQS